VRRREGVCRQTGGGACIGRTLYPRRPSNSVGRVAAERDGSQAQGLSQRICFAFAERSSPHELKTIALRKGHDGATCPQANVRAAQAGRRCSEGFELCGGGGRCTGCGSCCGGSATRHAEPRRRKCRHCRRRRRSAIQGRAGQASIQFCPGARAHHRPRLFGCAQQCCARGWRICPHAQAGLRSGKLPEESAARIQQLLLRASRTGNASFFPPFLRPVGWLDSC